MGDETIRIYSYENVLAFAIAGQQNATRNFRGFYRGRPVIMEPNKIMDLKWLGYGSSKIAKELGVDLLFIGI